MIPERTYYGGNAYRLFDDYNDIHVFVEDAGFENLYKVLLKKYGMRVNNIFSKNGKESVLKAAAACTDTKCIFVVDRDWDDLLSIMPKLKNVVVLSMHSIECYLINYNAFSEILLSEFPRRNINSLLSKKHFNNILSNVSKDLRPLFECFATMIMNKSKIKGCSHKPGRFQQKNNSGKPDVKEISKFVSDIGIVVPKSVKSYFSAKYLTKKGHGKYMLHYVWEGIRNKSKVNKIQIEKLMMRLAQFINTKELEALNSEIKALASQLNLKKSTNR